MMRRAVSRATALATVFGWIAMITPSPAGAGFLTESPTSVGTLDLSQGDSPNPVITLTLGGSILSNFIGTPDQGGAFSESAFKFNLTSLVGAQINSATFTFTVADAETLISKPSLDVNGFASSSPTVTIPDFSSNPTFLGTTGTLPDTGPMGLNETFNISATSFIQSLVNGGVSTAGFLTSVGGTSGVDLYGDASFGASFAPSLSISFTAATVPEPSSLALCTIAGVVGLAALRARSIRSA